MKRFLVFLLALIPLFTMAQSRIYKGNSTYSGNRLYTFDGKHIYRGRSTYSGNIFYTINGSIPIPVLVMTM